MRMLRNVMVVMLLFSLPILAQEKQEKYKIIQALDTFTVSANSTKLVITTQELKWFESGKHEVLKTDLQYEVDLAKVLMRSKDSTRKFDQHEAEMVSRNLRVMTDYVADRLKAAFPKQQPELVSYTVYDQGRRVRIMLGDTTATQKIFVNLTDNTMSVGEGKPVGFDEYDSELTSRNIDFVSRYAMDSVGWWLAKEKAASNLVQR